MSGFAKIHSKIWVTNKLKVTTVLTQIQFKFNSNRINLLVVLWQIMMKDYQEAKTTNQIIWFLTGLPLTGNTLINRNHCKVELLAGSLTYQSLSNIWHKLASKINLGSSNSWLDNNNSIIYILIIIRPRIKVWLNWEHQINCISSIKPRIINIISKEFWDLRTTNRVLEILLWIHQPLICSLHPSCTQQEVHPVVMGRHTLAQINNSTDMIRWLVAILNSLLKSKGATKMTIIFRVMCL